MDVIQFLSSLLDLHRQQLQALTRQGEIQAEVLAQLLQGEGCGGGKMRRSGPGERELRMPAMRQQEQNPEAYLAVFEQAAASSRLPRGEWGARLATLLSDDVWAEETYPVARSSSTPDYYDALKAKILSQARAAEEQSWLDFSSVAYDPAKGVRDLGLRLSAAAERWLRPERRTAVQVVQRVALEQFVSLLPEEAKSWVHGQTPGTMEEAIRLAEQHLSVSNEEGPSPAHVRIKLQTDTSHWREWGKGQQSGK
ncbi:hypothetical protein AAFF_G00216410 [Aldrovandia affinis]|uniref:SCAN box domain-containing protein n=1 Tax=Aldrovandia affinis TaxID=143900 RepID=A0AAD7W528_9TELE|nr:hypothetical protein AAFF_G00216410 [Aldrovandia affinis]